MSDDFRRAVLEKLGQASYPKYLRRSSAEIVETISAAMVQVVAGEIFEEEAKVGGSKIGGLPDVPSDFSWPCEKDDGANPLALVCQINLAEAGPHSAGRLPQVGMLYLFSIYDSNRAYGYEIDVSTTKLIYLRNPEQASLLRTQAPDALTSEGVFEEARVSFGPSLICEEIDEESGRPDSMRFDHAIEKALSKAIRDCGGRSGELRMLGNAHFFREEVAEDYDPKNECQLFAISGYTVAKHAFGEGEFTVTITNDALAKGALDKSWLVFEPGT